MENVRAWQVAEQINTARARAGVHRTIEGMPIVLSYEARIEAVQQDTDRKGDDAVFVTNLWTTDSQGRRMQQWQTEYPDPHAVREEFEKVTTTRQALDFLRHNGQFSPMSDQVSWAMFQRWQRFVAIVRDQEGLIRVQSQLRPGGHPPECDLIEVLQALAGYPHRFFPAPAELSPEQMASIDRVGARGDFEAGKRLIVEEQRRLELWFVKPPIEIVWQPKVMTASLVERLSMGGAVPEFIAPQQELEPVMLISSRHVLTAIASSIYADRVAQVGFRVCPYCRTRFELTGPGDQRDYDKTSCREAHKKQRFRSRQRQRKAEAAASASSPDEATRTSS